MYSPHMVLSIPLPGKALSRVTAVAAREVTQDLRMAVHSVSFAFVTQKTCRGRKSSFLASILVTAVRFQMGVQMFATRVSVTIIRP